MEVALLWIVLIVYALSVALFLAGLVFSREKLFFYGFVLVLVGFFFHSATLSVRWVTSGHFPLKDSYENSLFGTWLAVLFYLFLAWRTSSLRLVGGFILPAVLLGLGYSVVYYSPTTPLTPALKSVWLFIHVFFAWLAYGAFSIGFGLSILYLFKEAAVRKGAALKPFLRDKVPSIERLDELIFLYLVFGFINHTIMIASGAIWAANLWGKYWSWDPVETWSLITWLAYVFYLHVRLTLGWRGKKLAWVAALAFAIVMMTFWGIQLFPSSYHILIWLGRVRL